MGERQQTLAGRRFQHRVGFVEARHPRRGPRRDDKPEGLASHVETISDGKRRIDRQLEFNFVRREVRMTNGGASITLPLGADARDPMSALFYVRTLPIAAGAQFSLPLTDNGRRSRLDVTVGGLETIVLDGHA